MKKVFTKKVFVIEWYDENNVGHIADFVFSDYTRAFNYANNLSTKRVLIAQRELREYF